MLFFIHAATLVTANTLVGPYQLIFTCKVVPTRSTSYKRCDKIWGRTWERVVFTKEEGDHADRWIFHSQRQLIRSWVARQAYALNSTLIGAIPWRIKTHSQDPHDCASNSTKSEPPSGFQLQNRSFRPPWFRRGKPFWQVTEIAKHMEIKPNCSA